MISDAKPSLSFIYGYVTDMSVPKIIRFLEIEYVIIIIVSYSTEVSQNVICHRSNYISMWAVFIIYSFSPFFFSMTAASGQESSFGLSVGTTVSIMTGVLAGVTVFIIPNSHQSFNNSHFTCWSFTDTCFDSSWKHLQSATVQNCFYFKRFMEKMLTSTLEYKFLSSSRLYHWIVYGLQKL